MSSSSSAQQLKGEGNALFKQSKYKDAIAKYTKGLSLDPKNEKLFSNRAFAYQKVNELQLALNDINSGIDINPKWFKLHLRKGDILRSMSKKKEALAAYSIAATLTDSESMQKYIKKAINSMTRAIECGYLSNEQIFKFMTKSIHRKSNDGMTEDNRPDFVHRLALFKQFIESKTLRTCECKDLFGFEDKNQMLRTLNYAKKEMGCDGTNLVQFEQFNQGLLCSKNEENNQIQMRFDEWVQAGMCHHCQIKMFEQCN
eukprot:135579_1